jgi:hypothetical protein
MLDIKPLVHVVSTENGWAVVRDRSDQAVSVHRTQAEAAKEGRELARQEETDFILHARDGHIRERSSYGARARKTSETATVSSISRIGGGAAAGSVLGTFVLPGVGTILGGLIGGGLGAALGALADSPDTEPDSHDNGPPK